MKTMLQSFYTTQLNILYGAETAARTAARLDDLVAQYRGQIPTPPVTSLSEADTILITYGDQVRKLGQPHFQTLAEFCETHLRGVVSGMHILPFFPSSSDDGFSVMDYRSVDPDLGDWGDVERLGSGFRLMFDGVINHASVQGKWFQGLFA